MTHPAIETAIATARETFERQGASWDERSEAAVRNLLTPVALALGDLVMPAHVAHELLAASFAPDRARSHNWLAERYDSTGRLRGDL